jgi:glycosyltransferase involved in cell wall biosynthesis
VIGISLLTLVPGAIGGSETYARALARALADHGELEYVAFVPRVAPDAGDGLPTEVVAEYRPARTLGQRFAAMARAGLRPGPIRARLDGSDAVHYPLTIALPESRRPFAVTLHDALHRDRPRLFPGWERALRRIAYDRSVRRARVVLVPSAFVRDRAVDLLRLDPARVHVAPHGIDHDLFRPGSDPREPFLLYPARAWPHKNHARLLEAFALVRRDRPDLELVLTGAGHDAVRLPPGVSLLGHVPLHELAGLYRRAAALVFPSLYEGFGQPPLEAMACGCPVAVSRIPPLEEVCGDAATYFDPDDPEAIADGIRAALAGETVAAGLERARAFTWQASAQAHEHAYRTLLA